MKKTVLLVDDSASLRKSIKFILEKEDFSIIEASNGQEALDKITGEVRLVISDINMPEMNGITLIKKIRASDAPYRTVPILIFTTESQEDLKKQGKEAGATAWIEKPFVPAKLIETILKIL